MRVGDSKVGGDVAPEMALDIQPGPEALFGVIRNVGFDGFEDWSSGVVRDRYL